MISNQKIISSDEEEGGLVISEATEFIRNLGTLSALEEIKQEKVEIKQEKVEIKQEIKAEESLQTEEIEIKKEHQVSGKKVHFEDMEIDEGIGKEEDLQDNIKNEASDTPFQEEPLVSAGLGATLALLSQKGLVQRLSPQEQELANKRRERELWLVEERKREKLRAIEKDNERKDFKSSGRRVSGREMERQREVDSKKLEREQIRLKEEKFKNYVPDVKIAYYDEFGRELTTKEVTIAL